MLRRTKRGAARATAALRLVALRLLGSGCWCRGKEEEEEGGEAAPLPLACLIPFLIPISSGSCWKSCAEEERCCSST